MLTRFLDEVISKGGLSLLPQNLDKEWFDILYASSVNFLRKTISNEKEKKFDELESAFLIAAVNEIIQTLNNYSPESPVEDLSGDELYDNISSYAMSIIFHAISNETEIIVDKPDLTSVFDTERLFEIESSNPDITNLLNAIISGGK